MVWSDMNMISTLYSMMSSGERTIKFYAADMDLKPFMIGDSV